jgi:hypothetical protein
MSEGSQGPHTIGWRALGVTRATRWCGAPLAPPPALLQTSSRVGKNRRFGLRFVQFQEYFLCNFSKTQKKQKIGNWHCGISSIG